MFLGVFAVNVQARLPFVNPHHARHVSHARRRAALWGKEQSKKNIRMISHLANRCFKAIRYSFLRQIFN